MYVYIHICVYIYIYIRTYIYIYIPLYPKPHTLMSTPENSTHTHALNLNPKPQTPIIRPELRYHAPHSHR